MTFLEAWQSMLDYAQGKIQEMPPFENIEHTPAREIEPGDYIGAYDDVHPTLQALLDAAQAAYGFAHIEEYPDREFCLYLSPADETIKHEIIRALGSDYSIAGADETINYDGYVTDSSGMMKYYRDHRSKAEPMTAKLGGLIL